MSDTDVKIIPLSKIQKLIGKRMLKTKLEQPCFYMTVKARACQLNELRRSISRQTGTKISVNDFFIKAIAIAAAQYPLMVGIFKNEYIQIADSINVGFAVDAPKGLVVPVIKDADRKNLTQIARQSCQLIEKARADRLSIEDLSGGCITLTALGMFGIDSFLAIPLPGQCCIISVGKMLEEPTADDEKIISKRFVEFGLAADGRIVDYYYAAEFFTLFANLVSDPQRLIS